MTRNQISARIYELRQQICELEAARDDLDGRTLVQCLTSNHGIGCGAKFQIRKLQYLRTHRHVPPRGCSEGDYWKEGEGQFVCPKCGVRNRLLAMLGQPGHDQAREDVCRLKKLFASIKDES